MTAHKEGPREAGRRLILAGSGAKEERAGFAPAGTADVRIALFRACHYPPARNMLTRI